MQAKKKFDHEVHIFAQKTAMKLIPKKPLKLQKQTKKVQKDQRKSGLTSKFSLSSILWRQGSGQVQKSSSVKSQVISQPVSRSESNISDNSQQQGQQNEVSPIHNYNLKFFVKLSPDHILIGNEMQLDLIFIAGINSNNFVQTEYLQSIFFNDPIEHVSVDQKKMNLMAIVTGKKLCIYKLDSKKFAQAQAIKPTFEIPLQESPKFVHIVKDGNVCLFYEQKLQIYLMGDQIRKRYGKSYARPDVVNFQKCHYRLFLVPQSLQNIINVFFEQVNKEGSNIFTLWCIQFQFLASQIKSSPPQKIYDIKSGLRKSLRISNYSKQIFLLNLGSQILALKKGYILDSATVNLKQEFSLLQYIGNDTLLHISKKKVQVYFFSVNMSVKPYRINVKPTDSIKIYESNENQQYFRVCNMLSTNDIMVIFQRSPEVQKSKSGEVWYSFYITRSISREKKMQQLFPRGDSSQMKIDDPVLLDKCDMAQKMGFTTKKIYLQLWSRSPQNRKQDYSILIATKDYNTIKDEIVRKMQKSSMNFKQIQNIEQACFYMLEQKVFSSSCTEQAVMDYISSHFFRRKLQMFKQLQLIEKFEKEKQTGKEENQIFKMTIRQYQEYKKMEIKQQLINLVNQFCHQNKKHLSKNIRMLLRCFKFVFRIIYYDILQEIVTNSKDKLLQLLKQIPELLPYYPPEQETILHIPTGFYEGVWPQITKQEENSSLYVDAITTIDNKQIVFEQVIKSINFKRNWLSQHDMVTDSLQKIKANALKIKSPVTFYFFASKIFNYIKDKNVLRSIVDYLQQTYQIPDNLKGNMFLIHKIYEYFVSKDIAPEVDGKTITLAQFFSYQDKKLIRHCFDKQRSNKGLLLKDIKDIYKQVLQGQANQKYNKALLNYFTSDLSQVSDLKYILNRINNQKLQFHQENQEMYQILVQALERKMKIGTDDDIPIEEVLIYIENIPLKFNNSTTKSLQELKAVEKIQKDSEMLRQAKLNMSIYDILYNHQKVFDKLIKNMIDNAPPEIWTSNEQFQNFSFKKLAMLQTFSQQIYEQRQLQKFIFFLYLSKVCEKTERIKFADFLLKNAHFQDRRDSDTPEILVLFMKKWVLFEQKQYIKNKKYLKQLVQLLPQDLNIRIYIQNELQFAQILSPPEAPLLFPYSESNFVMSTDLREIIFDLPINFLMKIDIPHLYRTIQRMQDVLMDFKEPSDQQELITITNRITQHQIYEFIIIRMISSNKLKEVLPLLRTILEFEIADKTYNIVYVIMFIIQISTSFNESNKNNLINCCFYYFYEPIKLLQIFEYLMNRPLSGHQVKSYIQEKLVQGKTLHKGYNEKNPIFDEDYLSVIHSSDDQANFMLTLQKTSKHLQQAKQQFKNIKYSMFMIMLCNSPYALAKYLSCSYPYDLHVKSIRSFLSYAIKENVFKSFNLLELGRRLFIILLQASKSKNPIEVVIQYYEEISLQNQTDIEGYQPPKDKTTEEYLMWKSAQAFKKKKMALQQQNNRKGASPPQSVIQKSQRLRSQIQQVPNIDQRDPCEYPFTQIDSDNQINQNVNPLQDKKKKKKQKQLPIFDASKQMRNMLQSQNNKGHKLFLSTRGQITNKAQNSLSVSIRQPSKSASNNLYQSSRQFKNKQAAKQKNQRIFVQIGELGDSQDFNEEQQQKCHTQRQIVEQKACPSNSARSSEPRDPRRSADSSPEIKLARFDDKILQKKQVLSKSRQEQQQPENAPRKMSKSRQQDGEILQQSNVYQIKIKQAYDADEIAQMNKNIPDDLNQPEIMVQSTQFVAPAVEIASRLKQVNKQALQSTLVDFDVSLISQYNSNPQSLVSIIKQLYRTHSNEANFHKIMRLMSAIVSNYPEAGISQELFNVMVKAQQAQVKIIPEIKFTDLITENMLCAQYHSKRHLFQKIYQNLRKFIDSQNIYKITQFVRRVFEENPDFQQQVTWDFVLQLCEKIQYCEQEDRTWNLQKIQVTLPKVQIHIWTLKIDSFDQKVLFSPYKQDLLQVFCGYLATKKGDGEAIQFLQNLKELDESQIIKQTLKQVK